MRPAAPRCLFPVLLCCFPPHRSRVLRAGEAVERDPAAVPLLVGTPDPAALFFGTSDDLAHCDREFLRAVTDVHGSRVAASLTIALGDPAACAVVAGTPEPDPG